MRREFLDPKYETTITVREAPLELEGGGVSRRLKAWVFENAGTGQHICSLPVHRTERLGRLSELQLEAVYLLALEADLYS